MNTPPPVPLEYQLTGRTRSGGRLFSFDAFVAMAAVMAGFTFVCLSAAPKLELLFRDFAVKLPVVTETLLKVIHTLDTAGLIAVTVVMALLAGALGAAVDPPLDADRGTRRRRRKSVRRLIGLFGTLLLGGTVVALLLPYTQLIANLSSGQTK